MSDLMSPEERAAAKEWIRNTTLPSTSFLRWCYIALPKALATIDALETELDAWKRYAIALDAWQEHCICCEYCHISAYQCKEGERILRGEYDEARKAVGL